ncbi:MAG: DUF362 domain-containing protein [Candidatus Verstraetearchaeota archaeon]|nr:DUF362 domain-containing protein [Candidatus Verstraetearchaeota archaeon]
MVFRVSVVDFEGDYAVSVARALQMVDWRPEVGASYLVKPNMLNSKTAQEGVTSDPGMVGALVRLLREKSCRTFVGDSPGNAYPGKARSVFKSTGMMDAVLDSGGEFVDFEEQPPVIVDVGGILVHSVPFSRHVLENRIINVPKLKTHIQTVMTGAVKNLAFGCIQGASKSKLHSIGNTPEKMAKAITDVYAYLRSKVEVNLMDAIVCMDGNGPSYGKPRVLSKILASKDALALDIVAFSMAGVDPSSVPYVREGMERGLGPSSVDEIEILGDPLPNCKFRLPSTFVASLSLKFAPWLSPFGPRVSIDKKLCTRCGECAGICPENAIVIRNYPEIETSKCIRCYACYEVCEFNAVKVRKLAILL